MNSLTNKVNAHPTVGAPKSRRTFEGNIEEPMRSREDTRSNHGETSGECSEETSEETDYAAD
ncbi:hypothetical protein [Paenibacillus physcomitrellae]|uniref:hypothetical protein n=1 Tax=Paenibacillus physcomitrellae TaxID=1619311 RepID=UPI00157FB820|nr:hypothetical protein [Paenibacillus physcomitrellae]